MRVGPKLNSWELFMLIYFFKCLYTLFHVVLLRQWFNYPSLKQTLTVSRITASVFIQVDYKISRPFLFLAMSTGND